jgi:DNA-binding Xre family transcriptional regulator
MADKLTSASLIREIVAHLKKHKTHLLESAGFTPTQLLALLRQSSWKLAEKQTFGDRICREFHCKLFDYNAYVDSNKADTEIKHLWFEDEPPLEKPPNARKKS